MGKELKDDINKEYSRNGPHLRMRCLCSPCDDPESQLDLSNGSEGSGEFFTGGHVGKVGQFPVAVSNQLTVVFELQLSHPEGNTET